MLRKERSTAVGEMLGMWGGRTLPVDVSQEGMPSKGRSAAEKVEVSGIRRREPYHKRLQQLLEIERTGA